MEEFCEIKPKRKCRKICCLETVIFIIAIALFFTAGLLVGAFISLLILAALPAIIVLLSILVLLLILSIVLYLCNNKKD